MRDDTPEHTKRNHGRQRKDGTHPDILAAYSYVDSVCHTANLPGPAWYWWAIREAFLAGISHAAASPAAEVAAAFGSAPDLPEPCAVCSEALCECGTGRAGGGGS